jgi:hypothetical protein
MKPPSLAASALACAACISHCRKASASSGVAFADRISLTFLSSPATCSRTVAALRSISFITLLRCCCWASASCDTATRSSSSVGGAPAARIAAMLSLVSSIGPPGSASETAKPATVGARRRAAHSSSV